MALKMNCLSVGCNLKSKYLCYTLGIPLKLMVLTGIKEKNHFAEGATILRMERDTIQKWTGEKGLQTSF